MIGKKIKFQICLEDESVIDTAGVIIDKIKKYNEENHAVEDFYLVQTQDFIYCVYCFNIIEVL